MKIGHVLRQLLRRNDLVCARFGRKEDRERSFAVVGSGTVKKEEVTWTLTRRDVNGSFRQSRSAWEPSRVGRAKGSRL